MHCDAKREWVYSTGKITKFPFSIIVGVEDMSFIDFVVEREKGKVRRVCIQRGDLLLIRGDVPHRGVENVIEHEHYRIHIYCDAAGIKKEDKIDKDTTIPVTRRYPGGFQYCDIKLQWSRKIDDIEDVSSVCSDDNEEV